MGLGLAFKHVLSGDHRQALQEAADELIEITISDLSTSDEPNWTNDNWLIGDMLPSRFRLSYTGDFARKFLVCLITVVWKLGQWEAMRPSCVAEELAMHILLEEAEALASTRDKELDFDDFRQVYFEDLDIDFLYVDAYDGIEQAEGAEALGFANLAFADWFKRFGTAGTSATYAEVHPFAQQ